MNFDVLAVGAFEANCSILWGEAKIAWVVDPGADPEEICAFLSAHELTLGRVVLTHGHFDHISAVNAVIGVTQITAYLHQKDASWAFSSMNMMPPYPMTQRPATLDVGLAEGDTLTCGGLTARIIHTPGHTPGSCCLHFEADALLVAGDTLFAGSIGRTDFPGGSMQDMKQSLKRLKQLPDDTRVICGHGPMTDIGTEKRTNPYLV